MPIVRACLDPDEPDIARHQAESSYTNEMQTMDQATQPPAGRLIAICHSGAHRMLSGWLDDTALDTIVLLDAAYDELAPYRAWLEPERVGACSMSARSRGLQPTGFTAGYRTRC
jgi:hypothetical protein